MRHNLRAVIVVLLCSTGAACGASYPAAPTATPVRLLFLAQSPLNNLRSSSSFAVRVYSIDSDGIYTDVTVAAEYQASNSVLRVTKQPPSMSFAGSAIATVVGFTQSAESTLTALYQGRSDSFTVTVVPTTEPTPRLDLTFSGSQPFTLASQTLGIQARYWSAPTSQRDVAASYAISDPGVAVLDGARIKPVSPGRFTLMATFEGVTEHVLMSVNPSDRLLKP